MKHEIKSFTKEDWMAYSGAEKFPNGQEPLIFRKEVDEVEINLLADRYGLQLNFCIEGDDTCYIWDHQFQNKHVAEAYMLGVIDCMNLEDLYETLYRVDAKCKGFDKFEWEYHCR